MDIAEKLEALEEIRKVKARYCRFVDTQQWEQLKNLFAPDCRFDGPGSGMGDIADRDEFVAAAAAGLTGCISVHHVHSPEIEMTSLSTAEAIWAMEDRLRWDEDQPGPVRSLHGMGHYHEAYAWSEGAWKISAWALSRLRVDIVPA